jgi:hypothetical protein
MRNRQHHIARSYFAGSQRQVESCGSAANADGVAHTKIRGEFVLKRSYFVTQDVPTTIERALNRLIDLLSVREIIRQRVTLRY